MTSKKKEMIFDGGGEGGEHLEIKQRRKLEPQTRRCRLEALLHGALAGSQAVL